MNMLIQTVIPAGIFFGSNQSDNSCLGSATPSVQVHWTYNRR